MGKDKSTKKPKLTLREMKYVQAKAKGLSNTQAAMIATGATSENSAKTLGHRLSTNVNVQEAVAAEFEKQGITMERIIAPIDRALDAQRVVIYGSGDDAFADVVDDHNVQLKAASMAAQLMGIGKQEGGVTNFNFIGVSKTDTDGYGV
jgi:phage terminase small subunit